MGVTLGPFSCCFQWQPNPKITWNNPVSLVLGFSGVFSILISMLCFAGLGIHYSAIGSKGEDLDLF